MRKSILLLFILTQMLCFEVWAQFNQPEYNPSIWVPNAQVTAVNRSGNTLYIGGNFTTMSPYTGGGATLNTTNGNLKQQPLVIGGTNLGIGYVYAVVSDGSGGWYIGGDFTSVGGVSRNRLAHILSDNTLDPNWNPNANWTVNTLALSGNTLYVGGQFTSVGGQTRNRVAALNLTNGQATSWNPNADGTVLGIHVFGATTYLTGTFGTVGGQSRTFIAAINTSSGVPTSWYPSPDAGVFDVEVIGTSVYLFGNFRKLGLITRERLAAVDATTGALLPWSPIANQSVGSVVRKGNTFYIAGLFTVVGGQSRVGLAALDVSTGALLPWNPGILTGQIFKIEGTANTILAAGNFTGLGGITRSLLGEIDDNTGLCTAWNPRPGYNAHCLAYDGNSVFVGGEFATVGSVDRNGLAAVDATSGILTDWNPNLTGSISSMKVSKGTIYVGGSFTAIGGLLRTNLAAIDSVSGLATNWNPAPDLSVEALALQGNTLLVGGNFTTISGQPRSRVTQINLPTGTLTSWDPNVNSTVRTILPNGNTIYIGGEFSTVGSSTRNRIAEVDANNGLVTNWNPNANNIVYTLALSGSTLYAGGAFSNIGGQTRNRIAALDLSTGLATSWNPGANGVIRALATNGTTIFAGGAFTSFGGQSRSRMASVSTGSNAATTWNPTPNTTVWAFHLYDNTLYAGGLWTALNQYTRAYVSALSTNTTCTPPATPSITAGGPTSFCGGSVTLTAPAGFNYLWSTGETTRSINAATSNSYTVRVISGGCTSATSAPVVVNAGPATPVIIPLSSTTLCSGSTVTLSAPAGFTYLWSTNETTRDIVVSTAGSYTVRTISGTCTSAVSSPAVVTVNPIPPTPTITASGPTTFTSGGSVTLSAPAGFDYIWSTGATTQDLVVTSSGNYTVRTISNGCTSEVSNAIPVTVNASGNNVWIWNGTADFTSTANWNKGTLPTLSADSVVFQSGTCTMSQNRSLGRVFVLSGAQLRLDEADLEIQTQLNVEGTVTGQALSSVTFTSGTKYIGSGSVEVNTMRLTSGRLDIYSRIKVKEVDAQGQLFVHAPGEVRYVTGHNHTSHWVHNASQSMVLDGPNQFVMEAHLDTLNSSATGAWYNMGPPIKNYPIGQLEQGVRFASGTYNNSIPTNSSVYLYDPTDNTWPTNRGYIKPTSATQTLTDQEGVRLWITRSRIKSGPLEFEGNPFLALPITFNLKYCAGSCTYTGSFANGFNLIKNPLLTGLNMADATKTPRVGINNAIWIARNSLGQFASYVGGVGVNGGAGIVKPGQAFFVEATGPGATLEITHASAEAESGSILRTAAIEDLVRLKLQDGNAVLDETAIRFLPQATTGYDAAYDAAKMMGSGSNISSVTGNQRYAINTLPLPATGGTTRIPLHLSAALTNQSISIETEALAQGTTLYLNHPSMSQPMLVQQGTTVQVQTGWDSGLELIVVPASITTLPGQLAPTLTLIPNPATTAVQVHITARLEHVEVVDQLGRTVLTTTTLPNQMLDISTLAAGTYLVKAKTAQGVVQQRLAVLR